MDETGKRWPFWRRLWHWLIGHELTHSGENYPSPVCRTCELERLHDSVDCTLKQNDFEPLDPPMTDRWGFEHDMRVGPCSCGAVHKKNDTIQA